MNKITRRTALQTALLGGAASCASTPEMTPYTAVSAGATGKFAHGVASGDPAGDSIIIWTRVTPGTPGPNASEIVNVVWETAADEAFTQMRGKGETTAVPARDWTVKILLTDLAPGETYYYRFRIGDDYSPVGRAKTLPAGAVESAKFAVLSCANYPFGYFNVYDLVARQENIDAVIHLGDYFYEYGPDGYGGASGKHLGRDHQPPKEALTLKDYRTRHGQYKSDPASQAMHAAHSMIAIWDDHETANDSWSTGAENHDPETEGSWDDRRNAAMRAYYEWMPVRDPAAGRMAEEFFRSYSYGDLLSIAAIETRLTARVKPFEYNEIVPTLKTPEDVEHFRTETLWEKSREMLGAAQIAFIDETFRASKAAGQPWRLVANQVIMAEIIAPDLTPHVDEEDIVALEEQWDQARAFIQFSTLGLPANLDAWDGYPAARERFYAAAKKNNADGLIVLTGDTHTWWANDLTARDGAHMGVELGVNSVTSPSPYDKNFLGGKGAEYAMLTNRENKSVRYISGDDHGFIALEVTPDRAEARYIAIDRVDQRDYNAFEKVAFTIKRKNGGAVFADADGLGFKEGFLF